jgi:hypothetical protein
MGARLANAEMLPGFGRTDAFHTPRDNTYAMVDRYELVPSATQDPGAGQPIRLRNMSCGAPAPAGTGVCTAGQALDT